jgi:ABC-2 type transport system permease protein
MPQQRARSRRFEVAGFYTLFYKEWLRFWKVKVQTIVAPVLTALLYLLVFSHTLRGRLEVYTGVEYTAFLVPGLAMMSVLQNSFANSSSSLMQSKMTGNIVFVLLPPLSHREFFFGYVLAAIGRGIVVGVGVVVATIWFVDLHVVHPQWVAAHALAGSGVAAFSNFIILPLTFLSGVFYSIHSLPPFWQALSHLNPIFYMIDGFRYGFFGQADVSPWLSLTIVSLSFLALSLLGLALIRAGWKLRP